MAANQQFCLRWNNHQRTLISVFDSLLESGTLVDCTLAAEGQYLKAHKVVLSACSPYLGVLLSSHHEKHPILILKDIKFQELKAMLDYMYRGEVNISQEQLGTFLKAAESLQIKGLTESAGLNPETKDFEERLIKRYDRKCPPQTTPPIPNHNARVRSPPSSATAVAAAVVNEHHSSSWNQKYAAAVANFHTTTSSPPPPRLRDGSLSPTARKRRKQQHPMSASVEDVAGVLHTSLTATNSSTIVTSNNNSATTTPNNNNNCSSSNHSAGSTSSSCSSSVGGGTTTTIAASTAASTNSTNIVENHQDSSAEPLCNAVTTNSLAISSSKLNNNNNDNSSSNSSNNNNNNNNNNHHNSSSTNPLCMNSIKAENSDKANNDNETRSTDSGNSTATTNSSKANDLPVVPKVEPKYDDRHSDGEAAYEDSVEEMTIEDEEEEIDETDLSRAGPSHSEDSQNYGSSAYQLSSVNDGASGQLDCQADQFIMMNDDSYHWPSIEEGENEIFDVSSASPLKAALSKPPLSQIPDLMQNPTSKSDSCKLITCAKCGRQYKLKSSLLNHQRWECGKEPQFKCVLCNYKAKQKVHLVTHMRYKHALKPDVFSLK